MKMIFSFDDYCVENRRLAGLLLQYNIPAIFFIECELPIAQEQMRMLHSQGFELGSHSMTHPPDLKLLQPERLKFELGDSKKIVEKITHIPCEWFCYPKGKFNEKVKEAVKNSGYKRARTTKVNYWMNPDPWESNTSVHVYQRNEYKNKPWFKVAEEMIEKIKDIPDAEFHLWGHAWEIEKFGLWDTLEVFLKKYAHLSR